MLLGHATAAACLYSISFGIARHMKATAVGLIPQGQVSTIKMALAAVLQKLCIAKEAVGQIGRAPEGRGCVEATVYGGFRGAGSQQQRAGHALLPKALHCMPAHPRCPVEGSCLEQGLLDSWLLSSWQEVPSCIREKAGGVRLYKTHL